MSMEYTDDVLHTSIRIHREHNVFDGHFPGNPVLPGVCTLQIVGELLSKHLNQMCLLIKSDNIKFLSIVIPAENTILNYEMSFHSKDVNLLFVKCAVTSNEVEVFKMKGSYSCQKC